MSLLDEALRIMCDVTPLKTDCGALCESACCFGEEEDGMILLPHEAKRYLGETWCRVIRREGTDVLICQGACPREKRPFACMLFPLRIEVADEKARIIMDPLSVSVCPLASHGLRALNTEFLSAARRSAAVLLKDPEYLAFFREQTRRVREGMDTPLFSF